MSSVRFASMRRIAGAGILAAACILVVPGASLLAQEPGDEPAPLRSEGGTEPGAMEAPEPPPPPAPDPRDVPPPPWPALETPPAGLSPGPWGSWYAGQDIDGLTRINLRFSGGMAAMFDTLAGSGDDAPGYGDAFSPGFMMNLEGGVALNPMLEVALGLIFLQLNGNEYWQETTNLEYEFDELPALGFYAAVKLRLPFWYSADRVFRFSRAEAVEGLSAVVTLGLGMANLMGTDVNWESPPGTGMWNWAPYFESTVNPLFLSKIGLEYRFLNFGLFLEVGFFNFGAPGPSSDPAWAEASEAEELVVPTSAVGLSIQF